MIMLKQMCDLTYLECVELCLKKYGPAECNYFANEKCNSKSLKISRTKEGLFCHHIKENQEILLSTPAIARTHPFEYQQKENLVYCNALEHLLLHLKIVQECHKENPHLGVGGVSMIAAQINGYYQNPPTSGWQLDVYNVIKDKYDDYIHILTYAVNIFNTADNIFGFQPVDFCVNWDGKLVNSIYQDLLCELQISNVKNNRLFVKDIVIVPKIGKSTIIAILLPEGYSEPIFIMENTEGHRQALLCSSSHLIKVVEQTKHNEILYPGEQVTDVKYGVGVIKDVALKDNDIILTVLYSEFFCVYLNQIGEKNLVEAKRIIPKS